MPASCYCPELEADLVCRAPIPKFASWSSQSAEAKFRPMIDDDLKERLSTTVQLARKRLGMTQEELAAAIERTPESVSNIERGRQLPSL